MIVVFAIIFFHLQLLSKIIFFPYPELFVYPYLTNQGLVPYAQILDQHFPGLMFLPINLDNLGMLTPSDARVWQYGIVIVTHLLLFLVAKRLFKSNLKALIANLLYLIWQPYFEGWVLWIDSFLPIFYLLAFYFLISTRDAKKDKYYLYSGLALGAATIFKQVAIPLALFVAVYLYWRRKSFQELKWILVGYLLLPILMVVYFVARGIFADFWFWTVTFNLTTFASLGRKYASISEILRVGFVFGLPFLVLLYKKARKNLNLILVFMIGALLAAYARFDFVHLQPALPFAILATVVFFDLESTKIRKLFILVYLAGSLIILRGFVQSHLGNGVMFFGRSESEISEKIEVLTEPNEKIFLFGVTPNIYQMTKTMPPGDIFVFQFPWFVVESQDRLLEGIVRDRPVIAVADRTVMIQGATLTDYAAKIDQYLIENYQEIDRVGSVQILRRK